MAKLTGTNPDQVPTNADLGTMAYQDKDNVHLTGRVVVSAVNPAPFTVPNASESLEINDGSTTKLLMYADNSNAYIQASKYDGSNPGRTLIFATKQGTNGISAESARFNVNGNLAFPSGQGIDFSASAGSGQTSSLLDDYEEGTWTPAFAVGTNITYNSRSGTYTKIGRKVYVQGYMDVSNSDSDTSAIQIDLPFSGSSGSEVALFTLGRYFSFLGAKSTSLRACRFTGSRLVLQEDNNDNITYSEVASSGLFHFAAEYEIL